MYIVELTYLRPLTEIDQELNAHRGFLDRYFSSGDLIASGPKVPRTGGIILARHMERERLDQILSEDPFWQKRLAEYRITEVQFTKKSELALEL